MGQSMTSASPGYFGDTRREKSGIWLYARPLKGGAQGIAVRHLGAERAGGMRLTRFLHASGP
jgi:hypothetical protein